MVTRRELLKKAIIVTPGILLATHFPRYALAKPINHKKWDAERVAGDLTAQFKPLIDPRSDTIQKILKKHHAKLMRHFGKAVPNGWHIRCPVGEEILLNDELENSGFVIDSHPNMVMHSSVVPNDPSYNNSGVITSSYDAVNAPAVWDKFKMVSFGSMPDCLDFDTGVQGTYSAPNFTATHPDLAANVIAGYNAFGGADNTNVTDNGGHGTGVAGILGAVSDNGVNCASIGWGGTIRPIKCSNNGSFATADIIDGINWVISNVTPPGFTCHPYAANSINSNIGSQYITAITNLYNAGFINFGATGDGNFSSAQNGPCDVPAPYMIGCTAVDGAGNSPYSRGGVVSGSPYASYGTNVNGGCGTTACAPGGGSGGAGGSTSVLLNNSSTSIGSGTSYSTPILCGIARFLKTIRPGLSQRHIYNLMTDQSLCITTSGFDAAPTGSKCVDFNALVNNVTAIGADFLRK